MNPLLSAGDPALLAAVRNGDATSTGGADLQRRSAEGDLAWQRAFEQARHFDVSGWFAPPATRNATTPTPKVPANVAFATGKVAERRSAMPFAKGSRQPAGPISQTPTAPYMPATVPATSSAPVALATSDRPLTPTSDDSAAKSGSSVHDEPAAIPARAAPSGTLATSDLRPGDVSVPAPVEGLAAALGQALSMPAIPVASIVATIASAASLGNSGGADMPAPAGESMAPSALGPRTPNTLQALDDDAGDDLAEIAEAADPPPSRAPAQASTPEANESLRVYAEWSAQGVRIWLGANADAAQTVQSLAPQLQQWLAGEGERLLSLTCNGRTLWSAAVPRRPSPTDHSLQEAP